ncbi:related to protein tyrosine phosphatase PPS1 [Melanopsichium pennsylvanicum]|uniref:Related to protein tyrosine phosphatase PPS1 n=2 Tax=Melanopsichium pennsylvanicum TaxID=63383 RepID=A0AAJ4XHH2_9BASI|nr:related to protein tyrosine phosphatase PPS1 [Melanopsichium pennsylvanicum 4]SNX82372.1 related to protein tyrosine phosphatase PPS1 [Melanopsichium pennsylvanicum]
MSQLDNHAHVSLHPLASRHGTNSFTLLAVNLPAASHCQHGQARDESADKEDGQGTPRLHRSSPESHWSDSRVRRSPSPNSLPQSAQPVRSEPPSYGIQHADLEDYPIIYDEPLPSDSNSEEEVDDEDEDDDTFDDALGAGSRADPFRDPRRQHWSKRSLASPIRAMSADQLAQLHDQYVSQDVPHNVVFPFLHGVDGSIPAQNAFFGAPMSGQPAPPYRGLTILRADMPTPQELERMQAPTANYSYARARARTFSSVTTQSSGSSPDTDDESAHFEVNWNDSTSPKDSNFTVSAEANPAFSAGSTASMSPSSASTVSSQQSRPSLFSVTSESHSIGSRTSVSTVSDVTDDGARAPGKELRSASPAPFEPQPRHSVLNSTVFPAEILRSPSICRTMYSRNVYGNLSESGSLGDEGDNNEVRRIGPSFVNPQQASGVSLRNFKIQCAKYATISDIVIYCPFGYHSGVMTLAKWVREAQATLRRERLLRGWGGLQYNVFVVTEPFGTFEKRFPSLVSVDSNGFDRNRVDFIDREREEMERMTRATEIHDNVWLGCTADAPGVTAKSSGRSDESELITPDEQANPQCFAICISCEEDRSPASGACSPEVLRNAARYLDSIDASMRSDDDPDKLLGGLHRDELLRLDGSQLCESVYDGFRNPNSRDGSIVLGPNGWTPKPQAVPVRTDASASHFVHSKILNARQGADRCSSDLSARGLHRLDASSVVHLDYQTGSGGTPRTHGWQDKMARKLIDVCAWIKQQSSPVAPRHSDRDVPMFNNISSTLRTFRDGARSPTRSFSPSQVRERTSHVRSKSRSTPTRRPRRVLLHCPDGYTETSVLALSYLMYAREFTLPEAYLDLQLRADRSFFVYPADVAVLDAVDRHLQQARAARSQAAQDHADANIDSRKYRHTVSKSFSGSLTTDGRQTEVRRMSLSAPSGQVVYGTESGKRSALAAISPAEMASGLCRTSTPTPQKCRANSIPVEISEMQKHDWFGKSRFDGSFPSRILPFLYLGNLDHASNVDMLQVLGITHLVSVGETALAPPDHISAKVIPARHDHGRSRYQRASAKSAMAEDPSTVPSLTYQSQGVTVLNVRNVSDDGIDSLRGTMREAVQFIEAARLSGGKVLVHCRVGVSRSTTIVLAYIMAHLDLGLVESYLLVRSRRLNIVIQPHLLFLWELRGWETFLYKAKEAQIQLLRGRLGSPVLMPSRSPKEASHALSALSIHGCSARSEEGSGSYKSAWSSPTGSPVISSPRPVRIAAAGGASSEQLREGQLLGVEIGAGAGSIHGFDVTQSALMPFGSGSPTGLPYNASRLTWGHLAREIAELNSRYFI